MLRLDTFVAATLFAAAIAVAAPASADPVPPPGFPDLSQFTESTVPGLRGGFLSMGGTQFTTPDGIRCNLQDGLADCRSRPGGIPGFPADTPPAEPSPSASACPLEDVASTVKAAEFRSLFSCDLSSPTVPAGQKVTVGSSACAVAPDNVTACITGPHGFVIQPSGSWTF